MENYTNQEPGLFNLSIEGSAKELLRTGATWARIIAIIGFVSAGIALLASFLAQPAEAVAVSKVGTILSTLISVTISIVLNIFLFRFATNTLASLDNMSQVQFNEGVDNLKTYFKMIGILIIIIMAIVFIVVLAVGLGMGLRS